MSELVIYGDMLSQPTRSIIVFCKMNNIKYTFNSIMLGKGDHRSKEYRKINPNMLVPAIILKEGEKEFILTESCSILRFLAEYYKVDNNWYSNDDVFRKALINEMLDWHHMNNRYVLANAVFNKIFTPVFEKQGIKVNRPDTFDKIPTLLTKLDERLAHKKYLIDDKISIADLIYASEIDQLKLLNYDLSSYKHLSDYMNRMNCIPEMIEANQILEKLKNKIISPKF
jgi:glutathione S-transferase